MKKMKHLYTLAGYVVAALTLFHPHLIGHSKLTAYDPTPAFTAGNPLSPYITTANCCPEHRAQFSASTYRQYTKTGKAKPMDADVPLGDIHGRWNTFGLFYFEKDDNHDMSDFFYSSLPLQEFAMITTGDPAAPPLNEWFYFLSESRNHDAAPDATESFGYYSVPIDYRKYGVRFEADIATPFGLGARVDVGIAHITQRPEFQDQTPKSAWYTKPSDIPGSIVASGDDTMFKNVLTAGITNHPDIIADLLDLSIDEFDKSGIDAVDLSLYWSRSWESNRESSRDLPYLTFTPYVAGELSLPTSAKRDTRELFAVPFGNNGHWGYGFTAGFGINFLESIQFGIDASMTKFNRRLYPNHPTPTSEYQVGWVPRKADLMIRPGTNWSFGATIAADDFIEHVSFSSQFRYVHHDLDKITLVRTRPLPTMIGTPEGSTDFADNLRLDVLEDQSIWSSCFLTTAFTFTISNNIELGLLWQAPIRQRAAPRPMTWLGSVLFVF